MEDLMWRTDQWRATPRAELDLRSRETRLRLERHQEQLVSELRLGRSRGFALLFWFSSQIRVGEEMADEGRKATVTEAQYRLWNPSAHELANALRRANAKASRHSRVRGRAGMRAAHRNRAWQPGFHIARWPISEVAAGG
jgi:hypothetical protein